MITYLKYILPVIFLFSISCKNKDKKKEEELLFDYIKEQEIIQNPTKSGLYYLPTGFSTSKSLNSASITDGDTVIFLYKGYVLSNNFPVFVKSENTKPEKLVFGKDDYIKGFEEGISYMKKGESAKFIIPSKLAYGKEEVGLIPSYSTLIFEVKVIDIK